MTRGGAIKVLDFGLGKVVKAHSSAPHCSATRHGAILGTAAYMSPEQARGLDIDARTDIWSLGVIMYEMIAGRPPFRGETKSHTVVSILESDPPSLTSLAPEAPAEFQRIVRKALTKDRDNRYQTARDLMIDIRNLRRDLDVQSELERMTSGDAGSRQSD
jgi:serine/threonine protein kinase